MNELQSDREHPETTIGRQQYLEKGENLRSDTKVSLCVMVCLCLLAAPQSFASDSDAAHTAELIRLHHESIALLGSVPTAQHKSESRICEQAVDPARYDAKRFLPKAAPDT